MSTPAPGEARQRLLTTSLPRLFLTLSGGIAVATDDVCAETLLRDADSAMYRAKERGRARCEFFDETMRTEAAARLDLQNALHRALERGEFRVWYQPLIDVKSHASVGVEALVRWQHPERGLVDPSSFIPVAEESGLILPIGASVLRQAARDFADWRRRPRHPWTVSVNVSGRQLRQPGFADDVLRVLGTHGLEPSMVCLELTESVLMEDIDGHIRTLLELREGGIRVAIDDFGTGYSSLAYLKRLPLDQIKIDRSFVRDILDDPNDAVIVRSIIGLAKSLGLHVLAEGVETDQQREVLLALGCVKGQGYLFAPPGPALELDRLLVGVGPIAVLHVLPGQVQVLPLQLDRGQPAPVDHGDLVLQPIAPQSPGCEQLAICCTTKFACVAEAGGTATNKLGQTFAEIADATGVNAETAKSRLRYAAARLKQALDEAPRERRA